MTFQIAGIDMTPYIAFGGLKWTRADVDGSNAGRLMTGDMQRDRVAEKLRWDVTTIPLPQKKITFILSLIQPEFYTVTYTDLETGLEKNGTFYSNNFSVEYVMKQRNGDELLKMSFPVIMK